MKAFRNYWKGQIKDISHDPCLAIGIGSDLFHTQFILYWRRCPKSSCKCIHNEMEIWGSLINSNLVHIVVVRLTKGYFSLLPIWYSDWSTEKLWNSSETVSHWFSYKCLCMGWIRCGAFAATKILLPCDFILSSFRWQGRTCYTLLPVYILFDLCREQQ